MYTSEQCLEKLKTASSTDSIAWKLEYDAALAREAADTATQDQYADLLRNLHSNGFARSSEPVAKKKKAFDEIVDESIEIEDEPVFMPAKKVAKPEECTSCEIVKKRRGRKAKGNQ